MMTLVLLWRFWVSGEMQSGSGDRNGLDHVCDTEGQAQSMCRFDHGVMCVAWDLQLIIG